MPKYILQYKFYRTSHQGHIHKLSMTPMSLTNSQKFEDSLRRFLHTKSDCHPLLLDYMIRVFNINVKISYKTVKINNVFQPKHILCITSYPLNLIEQIVGFFFFFFFFLKKKKTNAHIGVSSQRLGTL